MKRFAFLPIALLLFSCGSQNLQKALDTNTPELSCPEPNSCIFEVMRNKSLVIKEDGTGKLYYSTADARDKSVVKYTYKKTDARLADAGYTESVVFEIDDTEEKPDYSNTGITRTNMLFGVMCFCKDKAGYYRVTQGTLNYANNTLNIMLPDIVEGQKLKNITVKFK